MRILLASHGYPPRRLAGVEVYTRELARALRSDHEVRLLYPVRDARRRDGSIERVTVDADLVAYEVAQEERYRRFEDTYTGARIAGAIDEAVAGFSPDVVHVQHLDGLGTAWLDGDAVAQARRYMTVHDHFLSCGNGGQRYHRELGACPLADVERCARCTAHMNALGLAIRRSSRRARARGVGARSGPDPSSPGSAFVARGRSLLARLDRDGAARIRRRLSAMRDLVERLDGLFVPSHSLRQDLIELGLPGERIRHLAHGIDLRRYTPRTPPRRPRRFGFLGSIVPHKGVDVLVEAFRALSLLSTPAPSVELVIAGRLDTDPGYVSRLVGAGLPESVNLPGELDHDAVPAFLAELDCLVVPSVWAENAPLVVLEAFAAGVPVIASRIGGLPELLARGGGTTFVPGSAEDLARILSDVCSRDGVYASWVSSIPPVRSLAAHVAELTDAYGRAPACRLR